MEFDYRLARVLGDLAVEMQTQKGSADTLQSIVKAGADVVPGARWAGISLLEGKRVVPEVPTDPIVAKLDELQSELGDGPCFAAIRERRTVLIDDMTTDTQWPQFARQAVELGVRSLLSFQLFVPARNLGSLNLYGDTAGAFTDDSIETGEILAQHAAVAMQGENAQRQFQSALASRDMIGQAKGILMLRNSVTGVEAFAMLTRASQETNLKLVDVASWLVSEHETGLPPA